MTRVWTFLSNEAATAAVEFALTMPLVFIMLFGCVDIGVYFVNIDRARRAAVEAADILSQWTPSDGVLAADGATLVLGPNGMTNILTAVGGQDPTGSGGTGKNFGLILSLVRECTTVEVTGKTCPNGAAPVYLQGQVKRGATAAFASMLGGTENATPVGYVAAAGTVPALVQTVPIAAADQIIFAEVTYTYQPYLFSAVFLGQSSLIPSTGFTTIVDFAAFRSRQPIAYCDSTTPATLGPCTTS